MGTYGYDLRTLESLLEESQSHLPQTERTAINRDLTGLIQQTNELSSSIQAPYRHESRMDVVLASRGFDNERHRRTLQGVMASRVFTEPPQAAKPVDLGLFLQHRHNLILLTAIEETKKKTLDSHEEAYARTLDAEWAQAKLDLEGLLGQRRGHAMGPQPSIPELPQIAAAQAVQALPWVPAVAGAKPTVMDARMKAYADQVKELAAAYLRQEEAGLPIRKFRDGCATAARTAPGTVERQRLVSECWEIIRFLTDDTGGALTSLSMALEGAALAQMKLVKNSRSCLESQYWQHMRARLAEHGQPLNLPVRQVVDLYRQQTEGSHWGHPAWATVYLGFRSGQYEAALQSADEAAGVVPPVVREEIRRYVQTANRQAFEASEALRAHWRDLQNRWANDPHVGADPFEVAVHLLLIRGESHRAVHSLVKTCQDFLWFKLCFVKSAGDGPNDADASNPAAPTLRAVQAQLLAESAAGLKQQTADRLLWFKALLYVGLFGQAIHYLMTELDGFQVEAVHFAIALNAFRILPTTPKPDDPILVEDKVNLYLIVHEYGKFIAPTNALEAVSYYAVLDPENEGAVDALLATLLVDHGFHAELFPSSELLDPYGAAGAVEGVLGHDRTRRLALRAAERAHQLGKYSAMVAMYLVAVQLSRGQDDEVREYAAAVLEEVNRLLGGVLQVGTPNREEYLSVAQKVDQVLRSLSASRQVDVVSGRYATFRTLMALAEFFQCVREEADSRALQIAEEVGLLPTGEADVQNKARAFRTGLDESVKRDFAAFVAAFLSLLLRRSRALRQMGTAGPEVLRIKERAHCVMNFVGQSGVTMSMDVQKRLMDLQEAIAA
jgi:hypothetical protein